MLVAGVARAEDTPSADAPSAEAPSADAPLPLLNPDATAPAEGDQPSRDTGTLDQVSEEKPEPKSCPSCRSALGGQALWITGKFVPELAVRIDPHRFIWVDAELGLAFLTSPPPGDDRVVLGSPFGIHAMVVPLRTKRFELAAGAGFDAHPLWGIGPGIWEVALTGKLSGTVWVTPRLGLFGSARMYPLATKGLELGERRNGRPGLPVLFATGVECGFP